MSAIQPTINIRVAKENAYDTQSTDWKKISLITGLGIAAIGAACYLANTGLTLPIGIPANLGESAAKSWGMCNITERLADLRP